MDQDNLHPDKVPLAFGIKISHTHTHTHTHFTTPRDRHGFSSDHPIACFMILWKFPMPI